MFSATVRFGTSVSSWWTKASPRRVASSGPWRRTGSPSIDDLALVGLDDAGEDLDQRALAGAVLAEQADDRAGHDHAVGMVERDARRGSA